MYNELEISIATEQDLDSLTGLMAAFRNHLGQSDPPDDALRASLTHLLKDKDTEFSVVRAEGGALLGYAQLRYRYSAWVSGFEAQLEDLYVVLPARGLQVGKRLLQVAWAQATRRGARAVGLNTNERKRLQWGYTSERVLCVCEGIGKEDVSYGLKFP